MLSRRLENRLRRQGIQYIAGLDEVGKGALAGPLVAACVILPAEIKASGINDSKKLTPVRREQLFLHITKNALQWSVGIVAHTLIDKIGIREANALAFHKALRRLSLAPEHILLDGLKLGSYPMDYTFVVGGDAKILSIAAASIVAKVTRDHMMRRFDREFPDYGFAQHKGYGTLEHLKAIRAHGPSEIHRLTFSPLKKPGS